MSLPTPEQFVADAREAYAATGYVPTAGVWRRMLANGKYGGCPVTAIGETCCGSANGGWADAVAAKYGVGDDFINGVIHGFDDLLKDVSRAEMSDGYQAGYECGAAARKEFIKEGT